MAKKNNLYQVVVFKNYDNERQSFVIYETTKRDKAEKYLHDYLKINEDNVDGAYIECKPMARFNKREAYEEDM